MYNSTGLTVQVNTAAKGLMFHHFYGGAHPDVQGAISTAQFADILEFVGVKRILDPYEWCERARRGALDERDLCITFDDSLRCQFDLALPVLESYGLKAFWFVYSSVFEGQFTPLEIYRWFRTTQFARIDDFYTAFDAAVAGSPFSAEMETALAGFVARNYLAECAFYSDADRRFRFQRDVVLGPQRYDRIMGAMIDAAGVDMRAVGPSLWMDDACLRDLDSRGHIVGLHSYSHPMVMASLPPDDQAIEYLRNFQHLERVLGKKPETMSHPSGSYNAATLAILRNLGISVGFRTDMTLRNGGILELPREDHADLLTRLQ
jgi:peptidoglycan/xylan/chitin deacetylase (PgdA/CDA1 family)